MDKDAIIDRAADLKEKAVEAAIEYAKTNVDVEAISELATDEFAKWADGAIQVLEIKIKESKTMWDNWIFLPLLKKIRTRFVI